MIAWVGGRLVPEAEAKVSVFDRSFLYGDGLFETAPVRAGRVFRWRRHLERLAGSARAIGLRLPGGLAGIDAAAAAVLAANAAGDASLNGTLRVHVSRGVGRRGYSPAGAEEPTVVVTLHPAGGQLQPRRLATASWRVPLGDAAAHHKSASQLARILARAEAEHQGADEALLLNVDGFLAEAGSANLAWVESGALCCPPVADGGLPGVTRGVLLELAPSLGLTPVERRAGPEALFAAAAVLLTASGFGVARALSIDGRLLPWDGAGEKVIAEYDRVWREDAETPGRPAEPG